LAREPGDSGIPQKQGFDYFFGFIKGVRAHNYYTDYLWENSEKVHLPNKVQIVQEGYAKGVGSYATEKKVYVHDLFTEKALEYIEDRQGNPFFLYLPYQIPHANNERKPNGMEVPTDAPYSNKDWPQIEKNKAAMITRMDADVERILEKLKDLNLHKNTYVFFSSDNGPDQGSGVVPEFFKSNGPLRGAKMDLFEGGIRVPLIAWAPGRIPSGTESDHISAFWDMFPTIAELANVLNEFSTDGISIVPILKGEPENQQNHKYLYWELQIQGDLKQAVRMGQWKGVRQFNYSPIELYNLMDDIGEKKNVSVENPKVLKKMKSIFQKYN
jgi:arylsulfatase A-like enzyme